MKNYYIRADLGDGIPCYDFVLKAKDFDTARKEAGKLLEKDYPEVMGDDFSCEEITADELLKRLTLN